MTRSGSSSSTSHYSVVEVLDIGEDIVVVVVVLVIVVVVVGRGGGSGSGNGSVSDSDGPAMALAVVVANSMSWEVQQKSKFELDTALPSAVHNPAGSSASQCKKAPNAAVNFTTSQPQNPAHPAHVSDLKLFAIQFSPSKPGRGTGA